VNVRAVVEACTRGSEEGSLNFGQESIEVQARDPEVAIAAAFDAGGVEAAVR